ncbi:MAG: FprA family A-type flavoprotein [Ruminiclostridium sp.]
MKDITISDSVKYIGADDTTLDLFESQYKIPGGVSYNSYVILDEKIAVLDTIDKRKTDEWFGNLEKALDGKKPDYLIISHLEPDHAANIQNFAEKYPEAKLVISAKGLTMLPQFFEIDSLSDRSIAVKEGDTLDLGKHKLTFITAPMVHWPEVMVEYESTEKILFSADAFGKFGALCTEEDWTDEARRYFINIVGKYGGQVQALLKKAAALDIQTICPLHGPVLKENLGFYIGKYLTWSSYEPEEDGVLVACASIHGNTKNAALKMVELLKEKGAKVTFMDITREDMAKAVSEAFRYSKIILAASSYDGGVFAPMDNYLGRLAHKNFQNRKVGIIENGSWAPSAGKTIKAALEGMKNITICENTVTIKSVAKADNIEKMELLAEEILD